MAICRECHKKMSMSPLRHAAHPQRVDWALLQAMRRSRLTGVCPSV